MSTHALLKEWHEKHWRDIENYGVTEDMAADFESACAAGPWRTDVENAPRDGSDILGYFSNFGNPVMRRSAWESQGGFWGGKDCFPGFAPDELLAFAVPNPPQVTT